MGGHPSSTKRFIHKSEETSTPLLLYCDITNAFDINTSDWRRYFSSAAFPSQLIEDLPRKSPRQKKNNEKNLTPKNWKCAANSLCSMYVRTLSLWLFWSYSWFCKVASGWSFESWSHRRKMEWQAFVKLESTNKKRSWWRFFHHPNLVGLQFLARNIWVFPKK